ncbi:hypothetical protein E4U56_004693 [Claviceps arundinis]|uniref:2EXR domain-containing protein n=1 Tax=Claviceps arundinis TaxID=1623583 RepID=A0A9P7MNB2_9HYPO|nr:hypothetical protein E4U56_004693 [Claviceps arundinis]
MYSQKFNSTNNISSADDCSLRSPRTCPRLIDNKEVEDPGEQPSSGDGVRNGLAMRSAFPRFMQLPPELRHQILHFYCPDLSVKARVLEFTFQESEPPSDGSDDYDPDFLTTGFTLASQTKSLRAMLSTHHESRSIAVRTYSDELALDMGSRRAIFRFRKESDVDRRGRITDYWLLRWLPGRVAGSGVGGRIATISGATAFTELHKELPSWKMHTRESLRGELERYLRDACWYQSLAESEGMKRFLEKSQGHTHGNTTKSFAGWETVGKNGKTKPSVKKPSTQLTAGTALNLQI